MLNLQNLNNIFINECTYNKINEISNVQMREHKIGIKLVDALLYKFLYSQKEMTNDSACSIINDKNKTVFTRQSYESKENNIPIEIYERMCGNLREYYISNFYLHYFVVHYYRMMYYKKYMKYKAKYLAYKNQVGGNNTEQIDATSLNFLIDWKKVSNSGQFNCGIYISDKYSDKIIKCEDKINIPNNVIDLNKILEGKGLHVFPKIYKIYKHEGKMYTEMEKFSGDLSDFLYKHIARTVLDSMKLDESISNDIWLIYRGMIPRTGANDENFNSNPNKLQTLQNSQLTKPIYDQFITKLKSQLITIMPEIKKQIGTLHLCLLDNGYYYGDPKLDNFAYVIKSQSHKHLNIDWQNNKFNNEYFYIHIIDWSSGLFPFDVTKNIYTIIHMITYYNNSYLEYSVHGQYTQESIGKSLNMQSNDINLPVDIYKILNTDHDLKISLPKTDFFNINQIRTDITNGTNAANEMIENDKKMIEKLKQFILDTRKKIIGTNNITDYIDMDLLERKIGNYIDLTISNKIKQLISFFKEYNNQDSELYDQNNADKLKQTIVTFVLKKYDNLIYNFINDEKIQQFTDTQSFDNLSKNKKILSDIYPQYFAY